MSILLLVRRDVQAPWSEGNSHNSEVVGEVHVLHTQGCIRGTGSLLPGQGETVDPAWASVSVMGWGTVNPALGRLLSGFLLISPAATQGGEEEKRPC